MIGSSAHGGSIIATTNRQPDDGGDYSVERLVRVIAVGLTTLIAVIYLLIGLQVLSVLDNPGDQTAFGFIAAGAFAIGAVILSRVNSRLVYGLGTAGLAFVIFTYFSLAPERSPQYETWGIVLRVIQVMLFVALGYLTIRPPRQTTAEVGQLDSVHRADETTAGVSAESGPAIHSSPPF